MAVVAVQYDEDEVQDEEPYKRADGKFAELPYDQWGRVVPEFADTANYLGTKGYYDKLIATVSDSKLDMPWKRVITVTRLFVVLGIHNYLRERVFEDLSAKLYAGLSRRLLSMTTDDLKKVDKAALDPIYLRLKIMTNHMLKKDSERSQYYHKRCGRKAEGELKEMKKLQSMVGKAARVFAENNKGTSYSLLRPPRQARVASSLSLS